jgi:hypothetical protein
VRSGRPATVGAVGRVAILFWFYRDLRLCRNRLELLRRENPTTPVFGLFGGDPDDADRYAAALDLDDFWAFDRPMPSKWKWRHGDLMLAAWYEARGRDLEWDHVFVAQWDMLLLEPLDRLLPPLAPGDVLLSAVRPVADVEDEWVWTRGGHRADFEAFLAGLEARFPGTEPMSCLFVVAALPRALLAAYRELPDPEAGYLEYRLPTLASAAGLRIVEAERLDVWRRTGTGGERPARRQRFLNGSRRAVHLPTILAERARPDGARVFHPYHGLFPFRAAWLVQAPPWAVRGAWQAARSATLARARRARQLRGE